MSPTKQYKTTNPNLLKLIRFLRKKSREHNASIWLDLAKRISKPKRRRISVNVSRIARYTQAKDKVLVPGKVLGSGLIEHPITISALSFSYQAKLKILSVNGKCLSITDLVKNNPKGTGLKIIG
jgi:large subunit ribosomal protein L18e